MATRLRRVVEPCAGVLLLLLATIGVAQDLPPLDHHDIGLLLDQSASLSRTTDPEGIRFDALKLLPKYAHTWTKVPRWGVVGFSGEVSVYTPKVDAENVLDFKAGRVPLKDALSQYEKATPGGYTDICGALAKAKEGLEARDQNYPAMLILFTDGSPQVEVPAEVTDTEGWLQKHKEDIRKIAQTCGEKRWPIHAVAFSKAVDQDFLREYVTGPSGGDIISAESPSGIATAIATLVSRSQIAFTQTVPENKGTYESDVAVPEGMALIRVEVFKENTADTSPVIEFTDPNGVKKQDEEAVSSRSGVVADTMDPMPGKWHVTVNWPNGGMAQIRITVLDSVLIQVLEPEPGKSYRGTVPLHVTFQKLTETALPKGLTVKARVQRPDAKVDEVELLSRENNFKALYPVSVTGAHEVLFDVAREGFTCPGCAQRDFVGQVVHAEVVSVGEPPKPVPIGKNATQDFQIKVRDANAGQVRYSLEPVKREDIGVEMDPFTLTIGQDGTGVQKFSVALTPRKGARSPVSPQLQLVPDPGVHPLVPFKAGPVIVMPVVTLRAEPGVAFEGQSIALAATAEPASELVQNVIVAVDREQKGEQWQTVADVTLTRTEDGAFKGAVSNVDLGSYRFQLKESEVYVPGPPVEVSVAGPTISAKVESVAAGVPVKVQLSLRVQNLFREKVCHVQATDPSITIVLADGESIVLKPGEPSKEVLVTVNGGKDLVAWPHKRVVIAKLVDQGGLAVGEPFEITIKPPMPSWVWVGVVCIVVGVAFLGWFLVGRPRLSGALHMLTPVGDRIEEKFELGSYESAAKRGVSFGSAEDDVDIKDKRAMFRLVAKHGGEVVLIPLQKDVIKLEGREEFVNSPVPLRTKAVFIVGTRRFRYDRSAS